MKRKNNQSIIDIIDVSSTGNNNDIGEMATKHLSTTTRQQKHPIGNLQKSRKKYHCKICQKTFSWCNDLRKHLRIHTDERPYQCYKCNRQFRQSGCLKNHIASQHGTNVRFICFYCNKSFPIKERLRLHMRIHSGERPYRCSVCPKVFARGGQVKQHLITHIGYKQNAECTCNSSYSFSSKSKTSIKSQDQPKICPQHNIQIKSFRCTDCDSIFSQNSQLKVHQRIHSGERPYKCQVCNKSFSHSNVLKLHVRKHTGEKPYNCLVCIDKGYAFTQLAHLKTHMRSIHGLDKAYLCVSCKQFFKTKKDIQHHSCTIDISSEIFLHEITDKRELSKLRLLVAILFKKISTEQRLKQLGFDKRLIDNVLIGALETGGQTYCSDPTVSEMEKLKVNLHTFFKWTLPERMAVIFDQQQKSIEVLLQEITSAVFTPVLI